MLRLLSAVIAVALVLVTGITIFKLLGAEPQIAVRLAAMVSGVALGLSLVATAFAFRAMRRADMLTAEMRRLVRSVDVSLRARVGADGQPAAVPTTLQPETQISPARAPDIPAPSFTNDPVEAETAPPAGNIVRLPRAGTSRKPVPSDGSAVMPEADALLAAAASEDVELSLQPIISIAGGKAKAFDVLRYIPRAGGEPLHVRRIAEPPKGLDMVAFERRTVVAALQASRRRLGDSFGELPLHVAISGALLGSDRDMAEVTEMLRLYPALQGVILLSADAAVFGKSSPHRPVLTRLTELGVGFVAEAGEASLKGSLDPATIRYVRIPAARLVGRATIRKGRSSPTIIEEAVAAGIPAIASDVTHDDEAVALLDLGVDLMTGGRFSGPRQLRRETHARPDKSLQH